METVSRTVLVWMFVFYAGSFFYFGWLCRGWREEDKRSGGSPVIWWIRHKIKGWLKEA